MAKSLILMRHAKSSHEDRSLSDFDRPLNDRGRQASRDIGAYLAGAAPRPDSVLCSSARRARETLEHLDFAALAGVERRFGDDLYLAEAAYILGEIVKTDDSVAALLVIGHNPGIHDLARRLCGAAARAAGEKLAARFPTGALAVFRAEIEHWREFDSAPTHLEAFIRPRDLNAIDLEN